MTLTIDLPPELERQLRAEAAREGQAPAEFARAVLEERLAAARAAQVEKNQGAIALMDEWLAVERTDQGDEEWEAVKSGLETSRRAAGERSLFDG